MELLTRIARGAVCLIAVGCASRGDPVYQSWGDQLVQMVEDESGRLYGVDDVSMLLGAPPVRTDTLQPSDPKIGVYTHSERPGLIYAVMPGSPADGSGLRKGVQIHAVNGQSFTSSEEYSSLVSQAARKTGSVTLSTDAGTFRLQARRMDVSQVYWDIGAGQISESRGSAYANAYSGGGSWGSSSRPRFFRATCRFVSGVLEQATYNWQG